MSSGYWSQLWNRIYRRSGDGHRGTKRRRARRLSPGIALERRVLLTTYLTTTAADAGVGSFRQAILDANSHPGPDVINFSIGSGVKTIAPTSALPTITEGVTIDATSQPGYSGTPLVELNGNVAGAGAVGLKIAADGSTVKGLDINNFNSFGILIQGGAGNVIQ